MGFARSSKRSLPVALFVLASSVLLSGCVRGVAIDIDGPIGAPVFLLKSGMMWKVGAPPCFTHIQVMAGVERLWSLSAPRCVVLSKLDYGVAPPGFRETAPAKPLAAGGVYAISASGYGWTGQRRFSDDGRVHRLLKN